MKNSITCRPCKEQNNWEIEDEKGTVLPKHFETKEACVAAGRRLAKETGCKLCISGEGESY